MEYINNKRAKELLGIKTDDTLKARIKDGLKCYGTGKARRFKEEDIKEYLEGLNGE